MRRAITTIIAAGAILGAGAAGGLIATNAGSVGAATTTPAGLVIINPTRLLDTRTTAKLGVNGQVTVSTGNAGAVAAAVNITLTDTDGAGFVTAWDGNGARPTASIINSSGPGQTVANYTIVPVDVLGRFTLFTSSPANLIVDLMGYLPNPATNPVPPTGSVTALITGYAPASTITSVTGTVTNGRNAEADVRVDVKCPNGTVETDSFFNLAAGATKGFSVLCDGGAFTTGATILAIVDI